MDALVKNIIDEMTKTVNEKTEEGNEMSRTIDAIISMFPHVDHIQAITIGVKLTDKPVKYFVKEMGLSNKVENRDTAIITSVLNILHLMQQDNEEKKKAIDKKVLNNLLINSRELSKRIEVLLGTRAIQGEIDTSRNYEQDSDQHQK